MSDRGSLVKPASNQNQTGKRRQPVVQRLPRMHRTPGSSFSISSRQSTGKLNIIPVFDSRKKELFSKNIVSIILWVTFINAPATVVAAKQRWKQGQLGDMEGGGAQRSPERGSKSCKIRNHERIICTLSPNNYWTTWLSPPCFYPFTHTDFSVWNWVLSYTGLQRYFRVFGIPLPSLPQQATRGNPGQCSSRNSTPAAAWEFRFHSGCYTALNNQL